MASGTRDSTLLEAEKSKVKPPPLFKVLLLNDDYTPMDFVVSVLQTFFSMTREQATQIMLKVHREGMGVCGCILRMWPPPRLSRSPLFRGSISIRFNA